MTLKKRILAAAMAIFSAIAACAEFTATDALTSAPEEVRGPLSASKLADLVEYARAGMLSHTEKNAVGTEARFWHLDGVRAELQTGPGRTLTLQLLPVKNDTVIAVIETLTSQQPDSRMTIYSRNWVPQPKLWKEPKPSEWGKVDPLPILLVEYTYSADSGTLTLTNHSEEKDRMLPSMHYRWTAKGFKRIKE
ncbi:MAG: DUF3256 family protein [Bacteroides sp.]|nr:DUF3256 family protein [Bacteroides sp.]MCM1379332.1 DUF3256 family protein [Bacteroides sp.]MCM1445009.1 DUF3256 family protein [Prevotella sp.]